MRGQAPAEGERRALSGYYPQYLLSAEIIYRELRSGTLEWIRVADPKAGRVDDLLVGTQGRVDAYQIKWSQTPGTFTYNDLTVQPQKGPSLLEQLVDGWQRLSKEYPARRVVVHLVTCDIASSSSQAPIPAGRNPPRPKHFSSFIAQAWRPTHESGGDLGSVPDAWRPTMKALREHTKLSKTDFAAFMADCLLEFGQSLPQSPSTDSDSAQAGEDREALAWNIIKAVADPSRIIRIPCAELLQRLGWEKRFHLQHTHEFPVEEFYEPIERSVSALESALDQHTGGYICLVGTPGSGKSSLLTRTFHPARPERIIRYYVYVPGTATAQVTRGEASAFLHDLTKLLEQAGFRSGKSVAPAERDVLLERLALQLQLLHEDWQKTGRRTIIVVDGLDHIERGPRPVRSLLCDLLLPDRIPDGIFFVLGTQRTNLSDMPPQVQRVLEQTPRRIEMQPLSFDETQHILKTSCSHLMLTAAEEAEIHRHTAGHPLALAYVVQHLQSRQDGGGIAEALERLPPYNQHISDIYSGVWAAVKDNDALSALLGLVCRLRRHIDFEWIATWAGVESTNQLNREVRQFFRGPSAKRLVFFHESFRVFLLHHTCTDYDGGFDRDKEKQIFIRLANISADASRDSPWCWDELYYRARADDWEAVRDRGSLDYFTRQIQSLRAPALVAEDLRLAFRAARKMRDAEALAPAMLSAAVLEQTYWHAQEKDIACILIDIGQAESAMDYVRDGLSLTLNHTDALIIADRLAKKGHKEKARELIDLVRIADVLVPTESNAHFLPPEDLELLDQWSETASSFLDLDQVLRRIEEFSEIAATRDERDSDAMPKIRARAYRRCVKALIGQQRWDDAEALQQRLATLDSPEANAQFLISFDLWRSAGRIGEEAVAQRALARGEAWVDRAGARADYEMAVLLAEGIFRIRNDHEGTRELLSGIHYPTPLTSLSDGGDDLSPYVVRIMHARLLSALGVDVKASELVPESTEARDVPYICLERALLAAAKVWGSAWRGDTLSPSQVGSACLPALRLFGSIWDTSSTDTTLSWSLLSRRRASVYEFLIRAVSEHGDACLNALWNEFTTEWETNSRGGRWFGELRAEIAVAFFKKGLDREKVVSVLEMTDALDRIADDPDSRAHACLKQARSWVDVGDVVRAEDTLRQITAVSRGLFSSKDHQFEEWVRWVERANEIDEAGAPARLNFVAQLLANLDAASSGDQISSPVDDLIGAGWRYAPKIGAELWKWSTRRGLVGHVSGLRTILDRALKSPEPPIDIIGAILRHLVIPISSQAFSELAAQIVRASWRSGGFTAAIDVGAEIVAASKTKAFPSLRGGWLNGVHQAATSIGIYGDIGLTEAGSSSSEPQDEEPHLGVKLQSGQPLSQADVLERGSTFNSLCVLLQECDQDSYFAWEHLVEPLQDALTLNQIEVLADLLPRKSQSVQALCSLAMRAVSHREPELAWKIGQQALTLSSEYGWHPRVDGGTRLVALATLVEIHPERGRALAWDQFISYVNAGTGVPNASLMLMGEFIDLLTESPDVLRVWSSIEEYLRNFYESDDNTDVPHISSSISRGDGNVDEELLLLAAQCLTYPVGIVRRESEQLFVDLLLQSSEAALWCLRTCLSADHDTQERALGILEAVALTVPETLKEVQDVCASLCRTQHSGVRLLARSVCQLLGATPLDPSRKALPPIYTLHLPEEPKLQVGKISRGLGDFPLLSGVTDLESATSVYSPSYALLEQATGIRKGNLTRRSLQVIENEGQLVLKSHHDEEHVRSWLRSCGLALTFTRPRAFLARYALCRVVSELEDSGHLLLAAREAVETRIRFSDPAMLQIQPSERPPYVAPIALPSEKVSDYVAPKEWIETPEESHEVMTRYSDNGSLVLGEYTSVNRPQYDSMREIRVAVVGPSRAVNNVAVNPEGIFFASALGTSRDYPSLGIKEHGSPVVIRHDALWYETSGSGWIALNPEIGFSLGWHLAADSLFRWVDETGETLVETIWWVDGPTDSSSLHAPYQACVGEGWLVLADERAVTLLQDLQGSMSEKCICVRSYLDKGESINRAAVREHSIQQ